HPVPRQITHNREVAGQMRRQIELLDGRIRHDSGEGGMSTTPAKPQSRAGHQPLPPSRLLPGDILRVASTGLRTRRLRAALAALGIAIALPAIPRLLRLPPPP